MICLPQSVQCTFAAETVRTLALLEDNHIAEDLDVHAALFDIHKTSKDFAHGFTSGFGVHGANSQHDSGVLEAGRELRG